MNRDLDREEYGLLVLIERMQREGRPEAEIEAAVRDSSPGRVPPEPQRPVRRHSRFDLLGGRRRH